MRPVVRMMNKLVRIMTGSGEGVCHTGVNFKAAGADTWPNRSENPCWLRVILLHGSDGMDNGMGACSPPADMYGSHHFRFRIGQQDRNTVRHAHAYGSPIHANENIGLLLMHDALIPAYENIRAMYLFCPVRRAGQTGFTNQCVHIVRNISFIIPQAGTEIQAVKRGRAYTAMTQAENCRNAMQRQ